MAPNSTKAEGRILLPSSINPTRYDIKLTPDFENYTFTGHTAIEVQTTNDIATNEITMHSKELCYKSASYIVKDGDGTIYKADEIRVNFKATTVSFVFTDKLPANATLVSVYKICSILHQVKIHDTCHITLSNA